MMKDEFDADTERTDGNVEEAESLLSNSSMPKPQLSSQRNRVVACFAALNVVGLLLIYILLRPKASRTTFPNPFPSIEYEIRSFTEEYNRDTSVAEKWDLKRDYPPFDGFIFIDNGRAYGLPPGVMINGKSNQYGTAWTHQYHCLEMIHTAYEATVFNSTLVPDPHHAMGESQRDADIHHMRHCFDYLRQHIICAMDMRLEYPTTNPKGINGYDIPRKCVKREPLDRYMGKHGRQMAWSMAHGD